MKFKEDRYYVVKMDVEERPLPSGIQSHQFRTIIPSSALSIASHKLLASGHHISDALNLTERVDIKPWRFSWPGSTEKQACNLVMSEKDRYLLTMVTGFEQAKAEADGEEKGKQAGRKAGYRVGFSNAQYLYNCLSLKNRLKLLFGFPVELEKWAT